MFNYFGRIKQEEPMNTIKSFIKSFEFQRISLPQPLTPSYKEKYSDWENINMGYMGLGKTSYYSTTDAFGRNVIVYGNGLIIDEDTGRILRNPDIDYFTLPPTATMPMPMQFSKEKALAFVVIMLGIISIIAIIALMRKNELPRH